MSIRATHAVLQILYLGVCMCGCAPKYLQNRTELIISLIYSLTCVHRSLRTQNPRCCTDNGTDSTRTSSHVDHHGSTYTRSIISAFRVSGEVLVRWWMFWVLNHLKSAAEVVFQNYFITEFMLLPIPSQTSTYVRLAQEQKSDRPDFF